MNFSEELEQKERKDMLKVAEKLSEIETIYCSWDNFDEADKISKIRIGVVNKYVLSDLYKDNVTDTDVGN